jgi:anti-sigma factor (TIGR02949 family)
MSKEIHPADAEDVGCLEAIEGLYQWLDGELESPFSIEQIEHHIEHCKSCYSRAEMERALTERLKQSHQATTPESLLVRVKNLIEKF